MKPDSELPKIDGYLSARDFASVVGKSRRTIYRWCEEGRIEAFTLANVMVIPDKEIDKVREGR